MLQQVADVCPLSEGHTLFTSSGVQCQRLSVGKCEGAHMHTYTSAHSYTYTLCGGPVQEYGIKDHAPCQWTLLSM